VVSFSLVVLKTTVLVSRLKFCGLGLGLEALVSAVFETTAIPVIEIY